MARVPIGNYDGVILGDSPLIYLKMNEASGTTLADSSGNGRNFTVVPTSGLTYNQPGPIRFESNGGGALQWPTSLVNANYAHLANGGALVASTPYTMEIWGPFASIARHSVPFCVFTTGGASMIRAALLTNSTFFIQQGAPSTNPAAPLWAPNATYQHMALTYDGSSLLTLILNGVPIVQGSGYSAWTDSTADLRIGVDDAASSDNLWIASLSRFALYNVALTPFQLLRHYLAGKSVARTEVS